MNLKQVLEEYIKFQIEVVTRRTQFDLKKAEERAHILEGLKIALDFIDEVVAILRSSKSIAEGKQRLSERFGLDDIQTQAIVQMPLGRLTGLERHKIEDEIEALRAKIADFKDILASDSRLREIVKTEALEVKNKFGDERRTAIENVSGEVDIEDLIPREDCVLTMTRYGYIKRQSLDSYKTQKRGGCGVSGLTRRDEDVVNELFIINSHDYVLFFTNFGRVYRLKCFEIHEGSRTSKGSNIANLLPIAADERVTSMIKVTEFEDNKFLIMVTKNGIIKRTDLKSFNTARKGGLIALGLDEGDELSWVRMTDGSNEMIVATRLGKCIRFSESDVRAVGRTARGVRAIKLKPGDEVVGMAIVNPDKLVFTVSETGYGRLSNPEDYRVQSRGGQGVINYHTEKYGNVASLVSAGLDEDVILISDSGVIIRMHADSIRLCSRPSKGVKVMRLRGISKVVAVACVPRDESEEVETPEESPEASEEILDKDN